MLAKEVIDRFETHVAGRLEGLRAQVIHNDMSRDNLLVDESCRIVGITDFGDMTYSALACDLAVALADVLDGRSDSLALAEAMVAGYCSLTPLEAGEGEILADLVAARAATAVVVSTWRRSRHDDAPAFPEGAAEMLRLLHEEGFRRAGARLASAAARFGGATRGFRGEGELPYRGREGPELLESRRRVLGPLELSYGEPLHLVRGEGVHVFDASGRSYLDAYNNVPVLGHCHPAVVAAIAAQAGRLVTNTRYLHEAAVELCERLLATAPAGVDRVLLVNSGSEANDLAWQVACHASGARGALVSSFAYHGITEATAALSPEGWPKGFAPSHVALVAAPPGAPPGPHGVAASGAGAAGAAAGAFERVATSAEAAVSELAERGFRPAALFADCAFTSEGIVGPAPQWVSAAAAAVREVGGLFVADEVQAGYGRSGSHLWSVVATGVEPDLITL
ncbi:MAG: aminotransferase class III-fold pyridoxal phosphate-dependent enzyme, partial [Acidimicrobiales bacterium]